MDNTPDVGFDIQNLNRTSSTVTIVIDKGDVARVIGRNNPYRSLPEKFRPALEQVGDYVRTEMIPTTFAKEGPGWAPLARMTVQERVEQGFGGHHPILQRTRDLYRELTEKSHPKHIEIIKVGKYARIELGGSSDKFVQNQLGEGVDGQRLPARPMIPGTGNLALSDRDRMQIRRILVKSITQAMKKS